MKSLIVGNGTSRSKIDLPKMRKFYDVMFACNAFYRDQAPEYVMPDYLVAIDDGMIQEILESDFPKERVIIPPEDERWEPFACNPARPRSNAGMNAMTEAIRQGSDVIVCVGFDFLLVSNRQQSVSNMFDGTKNYGPETRTSWVDNYGRMRYLEWMAKQNPSVTFNFLYPEENYYDGYARPACQNIFVKPLEKSLLLHT
jgi:hypothetical protein